MNHCLFSFKKNAAEVGGIFENLFAFLLVLALLVRDTAAGLASGLARSLALTATALFRAFAQITGFDRFDMFHFFHPL